MMYFEATADWATKQLLGESYSSTHKQSVYSAAPADWATQVTIIVQLIHAQLYNFKCSYFILIIYTYSGMSRRRNWPPCQCTQNGIYVL